MPVCESSIPNEHALLLCCAAARNDADAREKLIRLAGCELDWAWILVAAELHGVLPLLRDRLEEFCSDVVPATFRGALLRVWIGNAAHNLRLTGELLQIIELLAAAGIDSVPFKGPALAEQIFGSVAMRQFCDLDLLVRPTDVLQARKLLIARGYEPEFHLSPRRDAEYIHSEHAFQLRRAEGNIVVELHWNFGSKDQAFPLAAEAVWPRLTRGLLQGRPVFALSPEDLILYLCMHGAKHSWDRLEWICSLAEMVRRTPEIDWTVIVSRARETGALRGLRLGLLLAHNLCALPLPPGLTDIPTVDPQACDLAAEVPQFLFAPLAAPRTREFRRHAFYFRTRERLIDRARIALFSCARIPHPLARDWELFRLPAQMSFLYYFLRPIRIFREYGLRILQG